MLPACKGATGPPKAGVDPEKSRIGSGRRRACSLPKTVAERGEKSGSPVGL